MRLNPVLARMKMYPFVELDKEKARVADRLGTLIDFSVGDPREKTPEFIRAALVDAIEEVSSYPRSAGLPELRSAIAGWYGRRFSVTLDPDNEILPTSGSKEAIFSLAQVVVDRDSDENIVVVTQPGYPIPLRSAQLNGARVLGLALRADNHFLIDLEEVDDDTWARVALLWVNYPNNPTGAAASLDFYEKLAAKAVEHDFVIASDEAYSEIYFDEPSPSALMVSDRANVVAFNTLSKRSAMTGYRSGCVAGPPELIGALKVYRPLVGTASSEFIQRAAVAAWSDEAHVEEMRDLYRAKREVVLGLLQRKGLKVAGSRATFYLWIEVPEPDTSESFAMRLLEHGVVVAPGPYFGDAGHGYVRLALVPTLQQCEEAIEIMDKVL